MIGFGSDLGGFALADEGGRIRCVPTLNDPGAEPLYEWLLGLPDIAFSEKDSLPFFTRELLALRVLVVGGPASSDAGDGHVPRHLHLFAAQLGLCGARLGVLEHGRAHARARDELGHPADVVLPGPADDDEVATPGEALERGLDDGRLHGRVAKRQHRVHEHHVALAL